MSLVNDTHPESHSAFSGVSPGTVSFAANVLPNTAAQPDAAPQPSATTAEGSAEPQTTPETIGEIDWNAARPDGTVGSLKRLLETIGSAFHGEAMLCYEHAGKLSSTYMSCEKARNGVAAVASSATLEATRAVDGCLYATDKGSNSALLAGLREQRNAALALGIGCAKEFDKAAALVTRSGLVLLVLDRRHVRSTEIYAQLFRNINEHLPQWLDTWRLARLGRDMDRWQQQISKLFSRRGRIAVCAATCVLMLGFVPIPYRPKRECVIEPELRTFVASPIAGRLTTSFVRPGDTVAEDQLLARLNDEELQWQLASLQADFEAAGKRRDTALASGAGGELRLAQLEQDRLMADIESLKEQLGQLEIRSPRDGVVIEGDWYRSEGAPLEYGQSLFEIGDLRTMRVETHLTTADLAHVAVGQSAKVHVAAADGQSWDGSLTRIDTRGQTIDDQVVFVADMQVENSHLHLRPGMKGMVQIDAGKKSIGWLLFYRPYAWVRERLVW